MSVKSGPNHHKAKKRFGQNFLTDQNILQQIFNSLNVTDDDIVLEIGPGLGALTNFLQQRSQHLYVVEIDRDLMSKLQDKFDKCSNFTLYNQDILKFSLEENIFTHLNHFEKLKVVGNIPYNISTPILFKFFSVLEKISDISFMVQEEVANRLASPPGSKNYGRLSVMAQYFCKVEKLIDVDKCCFSPPPKVQSAFIRLTPHSAKPVVAKDYIKFTKLVALAFTKRRKTIANIFKNIISSGDLQKLNIKPTLRPENLTVSDFVRISDICNTLD